MTPLQQIEVVVLALFFSIYVLREVRTAKLDLRHAIIWLTVVAGVLLLALFPRLFLKLSSVLGFAASTNLLFILATGALAVIAFRQTLHLSKMEKQLVTLTQEFTLLSLSQGEGHEQEDRTQR